VVQAVHYGPAHTGGDAVITFQKAQVAHMGDLMFHQRHPFIDRPAGASIRNWISTLEQVVRDQPRDTIFIFGHAKEGLPVTGSAADLRAFRDYLSAVLEFTGKAMKAGQSREAITATKTLPGFDGYQEAPPRLTLGSVLGVAYDELSNAAG
jgi:cyclase